MKIIISFFSIAVIFLSCNSDRPSESVSHSTNKQFSYKYTDYDSIVLLPEFIKKHAMSFDSPKTWHHSIDNGLDVWRMPCSNSDKYCANYVINFIPTSRVNSLDEYSHSYIKIFENREDVTFFELVSSLKERVNGKEVAVIDYKYTMNNVNIGETTLLIPLNNKLVVANFAALNDPPKSYVRYRGLYERIMKSIKFAN